MLLNNLISTSLSSFAIKQIRSIEFKNIPTFVSVYWNLFRIRFNSHSLVEFSRNSSNEIQHKLLQQKLLENVKTKMPPMHAKIYQHLLMFSFFTLFFNTHAKISLHLSDSSPSSHNKVSTPDII